jgi:hypothetical protein
MNTHRAYMGADTVITCWVRDEAGARDMADAMKAYIYPYGRSDEITTAVAEQAHEDVESSQIGKIQFTVTKAMGDTHLVPGVYRFQIKTDTAPEVLYDGLLEMV